MRKPPIGVIMLDTNFPRLLGDIGNPESWPFDVLYHRVPEASAARVIHDQGAGLLPGFIDAGHQLVTQGAKAITTSCGFLSLFQREMAESLPVPVVTSALMQVGLVNQMLGGSKRAGILTIAASALSEQHLHAANVPPGTPIGTTEGGREFTRAILADAPHFDAELARQDNVEAALTLQHNHPDLGAIILECTNMGPYAPDITAATGLPVFSIISLVSWMQSGL